MKKILFILVLFLSISLKVFATENNETMLVKIDSEINNATATYVKTSLNEAQKEGYKNVIFEIDTLGGSILAAEDIKNSILNSPLHTIAYINNKAESAGVLISIACENVYMQSSGTIGSASTIPETEKTMSFWRGILKSTAQKRGRNVEVVISMVDKNIAIDKVTKSGELTNLTSKEALDLGISDGTYDSISDLQKGLGLKDGYTVSNMDLSTKFVDIISKQYVSTILLVIGMVGFVIEVFTPGFGIGGILSIIGFSLFFLGNIISGNSNFYSIFIFVLGAILIVIELIVPGFGIAGIGGIIAVFVGLMMSMKSLEIAIQSISIAIVFTFLAIFILVKQGKKIKFFRNITLENSLKSDKGYISVDDYGANVGEVGVTISNLRPIGFASFNDVKREVISDDGFIKIGEKVEIVRKDGFKIFVRRLK